MKIGDYQTHPAADIFELVEGAAFDELVASIRTRGLEHPIVLERKTDRIIDGRNRARASLAAGVKPRFEYYTGTDVAAYVWSVNVHRRHLTESQRAIALAEMESLERGGDRKSATAKESSSAALTQAQKAKLGGIGERTVRSAQRVLTEGAPEVVKAVKNGTLAVTAAASLVTLPKAKQRELVAKHTKPGREVKPGKIRALAAQAQKRETIAKINKLEVRPMPTGPFRVIVADPPWPYENSDNHEGSRGHISYPPMSLHDIQLLKHDIHRVAHEDCILFLWVTNAFVHLVGDVLRAWGFEHRSMITWVKDRLGLGSWARGKTEHVIIASRGRPVHTLNEITTVLSAPVREHSRKPDEFYTLVEKHCPGAKLEMFAREERDGWASWGAEPKKFDAKSTFEPWEKAAAAALDEMKRNDRVAVERKMGTATRSARETIAHAARDLAVADHSAANIDSPGFISQISRVGYCWRVLGSETFDQLEKKLGKPATTRETKRDAKPETAKQTREMDGRDCGVVDGKGAPCTLDQGHGGRHSNGKRTWGSAKPFKADKMVQMDLRA